MSQLKVYSAIYNDAAHLDQLGKLTIAHDPDDLNEPGILILHGGADISPSIYGKRVGSFTQALDTRSVRDSIEVSLANTAIERGIPIFGICRGAQLACALSGGSLIQHAVNHVGDNHTLMTSDGHEIQSNSCHHQMMNPFGVHHELIAWTKQILSPYHLDENDNDLNLELEPEIIFFPEIKALGVQGHPEWMQNSTPFVQYCLQLVKEKLIP